MADINKTTPMEDLTIGGNIYEAGNAREFKICRTDSRMGEQAFADGTRGA